MATFDRDALFKMDPELAEILAHQPPLFSGEYKPTIYEMQAYAAATDKQKALTNPAVSERDFDVPMRDGATITIRIYSPKKVSEAGSPLFVVYHGGGHAIGSLDTEAGLCQTWSEKFAGVAVNVGYRLAPQHPFPTGVNDNFDALKWCSQHLDQLNANPKKGFIVGGISAGGTDTAVVSHLYRDEGLSPPLTGLYLSNGATCHKDAIPEKYKADFVSRAHSTMDPVQTDYFQKVFAEAYQSDPTSPLASPLLFPSHKDLPPSYFQICGRDSLRDEEILYERVLREEWGVKTKVDVYPGVGHIFWHYYPQLTASKKHAEDSIAGLSWLLAEGKQFAASL